MRAACVVVLAPVLDDDDGFGEAAELLDVEQLVAHAGVEGLHVGVLPRRAGLDERRLSAAEAAPVLQGVRGQLRAVVAAHVRRRSALGGESLKYGDGLVCVDAPCDVHRERLAGELVDDVQQLDHPPVGGLIELEVQGPHVIGTLGPQPAARNGRLAQALAFAAPRWDSEAFLAPQPLHALAVDRVPELTQAHVRAAVPPPRPLDRDLAQQPTQHDVLVGHLGLVALRGAMLSHDSARPALADTEAVLQHQDRAAPAGWAHQFPRAISFSACVSSAWSATIRFNRAFSRSSSLRRLASSAFIPPYWLRQ